MPQPRPFEAHDDQERAEIVAVLKELPEDHPACIAHRDGADAIRLTHLVDGHKDLIERLTWAWLDGYGGCCGVRVAFARAIRLFRGNCSRLPACRDRRNKASAVM